MTANLRRRGRNVKVEERALAAVPPQTVELCAADSSHATPPAPPCGGGERVVAGSLRAPAVSTLHSTFRIQIARAGQAHGVGASRQALLERYPRKEHRLPSAHGVSGLHWGYIIEK